MKKVWSFTRIRIANCRNAKGLFATGEFAGSDDSNADRIGRKLFYPYFFFSLFDFLHLNVR